MDFKIVVIPAKINEPIKEIKLSPKKNDSRDYISCLIDYAKEHYKKHSAILSDKQINSYKTTLKKQTKDGDKFSDEMYNAFARIQTVDIVILQPPSSGTDMISVNMYVDDHSIAKNSPINERASAITVLCGIKTQIRGDVFIARVQDDEMKDIFNRIDFTLKDMNSDAPWFETCRIGNAGRRNQSKAIIDASTIATTQCHAVGCASAGTLRCARCKVAFYCGRNCQKKAWKSGHKGACKSSD